MTSIPGEVTSPFVGRTVNPPTQGPGRHPKEVSRPHKEGPSRSGTAFPSTQRVNRAHLGLTAGTSTNVPTDTRATWSAGNATSLPKLLHPLKSKQNSSIITTPIRDDRLEYHLKKSAYDHELTQYLVDGFTYGFKLGHGTDAHNTVPRNQKSVSLCESVVKQKIDTDIQPFSNVTIRSLGKED